MLASTNNIDFLIRFSKKRILLVKNRKNEHQTDNFDFLDQIAQKGYFHLKTKSEHRHWILRIQIIHYSFHYWFLHIQISLDTNQISA